MSLKKALLANNAWTDKYFAISVGSIVIVCGVYHWVNKAYMRHGPRQPGFMLRGMLHYRRMGKRYLNIEILGVSLDKWLLYLIYWTVNLILALTNVDLTNLKYVAKRFGWVSVANFVLLVFLALKNTLLAPLSGYSYEKLRPLHKTAGYTCIFTTFLHATIYLSSYGISGDLDNMRKTKNLAGAIAGLAMAIIGLSTITWLTRGYYEYYFLMSLVFYVIHIVMFLSIVILVGFHRPEFTTSTLIIMIFTACMWFADRLIRFSKLCWNISGNYATINPMANGVVRVKLRRPISCRPGSHVFLWMPAIRLFETHPFTLISADPAELLIRKYDGYTSSLYKAAQEQPGRALRCSIDGAYGQVPNFMDFDRVILVAGGSGSTFTFSIVLSMLKESSSFHGELNKTVDFIWAVKRLESLQWFKEEIHQLQESNLVNLHIYVTWELNDSGSLSLASTGALDDVEKGKERVTDQVTRLPHIYRGRPDIFNLVTGFISQCGMESRIGVGACGPIQMIKRTQKATSQGAYDNGPSITLHTEEFEW